MYCTHCGVKLKVTDVTQNMDDNETYRILVCQKCGNKFTSVERLVPKVSIIDKLKKYYRSTILYKE